MPLHNQNSDAAFLLMTGADSFRSRESDSWANLRDILADVRDTGTEAMGEISPEITNSCMDLMDITA